MEKTIKYILVAAVLGLLGYKSIYIKKLSEVRKAAIEKFDAAIFSKKLWDEKMPAKIDSAVDLSVLIQAVTTGKEAALIKYSNALGIGNYRYALIKTQATVASVNDDEVLVQLPVADSVISAVLATEYIYGNAVRDASALVDVKDFPNTSDLNSISEEMNKIIRATVLPSFKKGVKKGDKVNITAAVELNKEHIKWNGLELLPVRLQIIN
jgi:predicted lipoprotein